MSETSGPHIEREPTLDSDDRQAYRATGEQFSSLSTTVVEVVAEIVGFDPVAGQSQLYDSVDPDALDALFADKHDGTPRTDGRVSFTLRGCEIVAHATGDLIVYAPHHTTEESTATEQRSA